MNGHIRQRSPGSWELRWRANGRVCTRTIRGGKRDAERALREALTAVDQGIQIREMCKRCCLGVLYGMGARALAFRTKKSELEARDLLDKHRRIFPTFWAWSCRAVYEATLFGHIDLAFGWRIHDGLGPRPEDETTPPTLMNAPMQGNGAEMMRLAAIFGHRAGVTIDAPLHDAFLVEAREQDVSDAIKTMRGCMGKASRLVLDGVEVGVSHKKVAWPDRYMDDRVEAKELWRDAMGHLATVEREARSSNLTTKVVT
jgi:DNA polymerase-1